MKQYGKNRAPALPVYWCNRKAGCCWSPYCGKECQKTRRKRYARKDAKGKPMVAVRRVQQAANPITPITAKELADMMERVGKTMGVALKTVNDGLMRVTRAMRTLRPLFSGNYFDQ